MGPESSCPSVDEIASYVGGQPLQGGLDALEAHLDECSDCARVVIEAAGTRITGSDPPERARPRIFEPGQVIAGRYEVVAFLGAGGMGEVYEVQDRELGERVALKTVSAAIALDRAAVARFKAEAQLARKVTHRNVCRVFDLGIDVDAATDAGAPSTTPFLTMELIRGRALSDHIRAGDRFSVEELLAIARAIARGLEAAHEAGVLHRDLKCDNVLLAPRSPGGFRPVITDFGLAAAATSTVALGWRWSSRTPLAYGTRPYLAPERLAGAADTSATDIYSLGVVMYELVTGSLLARGPWPARFGDLPGGAPLAGVVRRCLERKPDRRPASAAEVLAALDEESALVTARLGARARRRRTWWVLAAAAAASLALVSPLIRAGKARAPAVENVGMPPTSSADHAAPPSPATPPSSRTPPLPAAPPDHAAPPSSALAVVLSPGAPAAPRRRAHKAVRAIKPEPAMDAARDGTERLLETAEAHLRAGRIEEACVEGRAVARTAPSFPAAWEFLGRCYMRLGEPAEARDYYRRYLQLAPGGTNAVFIRAIVDEKGT